MTHKKIWTLYKPNADYSDATYIMGLGCEVEVIYPNLWNLKHLPELAGMSKMNIRILKLLPLAKNKKVCYT